ncbi:MAG: PIN domain-containing protein [Chitinivibrionales bacterium]|nr:PIN domain-containing protein [Chitinivibrionales bacterium]
MNVLVDSSVWIDFFRDEGKAGFVEDLIDEDLLVTNELILAELVPALSHRGETELVSLLQAVRRQPMSIDWQEIIGMQTLCLSQGINGVGLPDLLIAQNALQGGLRLLSNDKHYVLLAQHLPLLLYA